MTSHVARIDPRALLLVALFGCGSTKTAAPDAAPPASPECIKAREMRKRAADLDRDGHEERALAALAEANAACEPESATSWDVELHALAESGKCVDARALAARMAGKSDAGTAASIATCDAIEAPAKGTDKTFRAKMHEAWDAENAKDFARARAAYLGAWAEQHEARALEAAARVAGKASDAAGARRLRDRALTLAEASTHEHPRLEMPKWAGSNPRVRSGTLAVGGQGVVLVRDLESGDVRVAVKTTDTLMGLSPSGTLAFARAQKGTQLNVYDVVSGTLVASVEDGPLRAFSPDDTRIALANDARVRVVDLASGDVVLKFDASPLAVGSLVFAPDRDHVVIEGSDESGGVMRSWNVATKAGGTDVAITGPLNGRVDASANGRWICSQIQDGFAARDMTTGKQVHLVSEHGVFFGHACTMSNDGKYMATGGRRSVRLWDVETKKQTFIEQGAYEDPSDYRFSDDGKAVVFGYDPIWSWDAATGKKTALSGGPMRHLATAASLDAVAFADAEAVHVVRAHGPLLATCAHEEGTGRPAVLAFSHDGQTLACEMGDGTVRLYDAAAWTERGHAGTGIGSDHVAMRFTDDNKSLRMVSNTDLTTLDAQTVTVTAKVKLKHPSKTLIPDDPMQPHAPRVPVLFDDGSFAVHPWLGGVALYDASGAFARDSKVPKVDRRDTMSHDGQTYAELNDENVTIMDVASGTARTVPVPGSKSSVRIALSPDAGTVVVSGFYGTWAVTGTDVRTLDGGARFNGPTASVPAPDEATITYDAEGVLATLPTGAFETRGKIGAICVVGTVTLERSTCEDRSRDDIIATWVAHAAR